MKAEGVRELAGMLFFLRAFVRAVRNMMTISTYLTRLHVQGEKKHFSDNCKETAVKRQQSIRLILCSGGS